MPATRRIGVLLLSLALAACGDPGPAEQPATPQARTQAALQDIFALVRAQDTAALAPRIVYRGEDETRPWKDVCRYDAPDEKPRVDKMAARVGKLLGDGTPVFSAWRSETESEGTWLVWKVKGVAGSAWFACLEIDGVIALGDIDTD
ncbi:MAG: hypothetical protein P1V36_15900 [Planctomycetota bacterium]|nr:hypothetical protein [Planctomycetota bacterium]